jgi:ankyrin repeat protein
MILQVDETMTKNYYKDNPYSDEIKPLGSLCRRLEFPTFHEMFSCLVAVDSSAEVVFDGVIQCLTSYRNSRSEDYIMYPGSRGEATVIRLEILLNMNVDFFVNDEDSYKIFITASIKLSGELGVAVLSLLLRRDGSVIKHVSSYGWMAIHHAAFSSSIDVLRFLHINNPESLSMLKNDRSNLLHLVVDGKFKDRRDKVQYLCDQCPALIHQKNDRGFAPIHRCFYGTLDIGSIVCLCNADEAVVRDKYTPSNINHSDGSLCISLFTNSLQIPNYQMKRIASAFYSAFIQPQPVSKMANSRVPMT